MTSRVQPAWAIHLQSGSQIPLEDEAARRYLRRGYLAEALLRGGSRPALIAGNITLSHDELRAAASGAAERLKEIGVTQGLHEELNRLPEHYRSPLLLCYLEGMTQEEAATALGWSATTLKGRLTRGRELLRGRLTGRGLTLSAGLAATVFVPAGMSHALPVALTVSSVRAANMLGQYPDRPMRLHQLAYHAKIVRHAAASCLEALGF